MSGITPDFIDDIEIKDNEGSTVSFSGTASTSVSNVPAVANKMISSVSLWNDGVEPIEISFDSGTTFHSHTKKAFMSHKVKGEPTQVQVKTLSGTSDYRIIINFEET